MKLTKLMNMHQRREFNPGSSADLKELKYFLEHNKWREGCPFYMEYPWGDIPAMCLEKYAKYSLAKAK